MLVNVEHSCTRGPHLTKPRQHAARLGIESPIKKDGNHATHGIAIRDASSALRHARPSGTASTALPPHNVPLHAAQDARRVGRFHYRNAACLESRCRAETKSGVMHIGLHRCRTMPWQSCTMSLRSLRLGTLALSSPAPAALEELARKHPRGQAALLSAPPRRCCSLSPSERFARGSRSRRMAQECTHPACAFQSAQGVAPEAPTLRQVSKSVEAPASDFPQAASPAVTTLAEEVAAKTRRIARSDAWPPSAPRTKSAAAWHTPAPPCTARNLDPPVSSRSPLAAAL